MKRLPETSFSAPAVCFMSQSLRIHSLSQDATLTQAFTGCSALPYVLLSFVHSQSIMQEELPNNCVIELKVFAG